MPRRSEAEFPILDLPDIDWFTDDELARVSVAIG